MECGEFQKTRRMSNPVEEVCVCSGEYMSLGHFLSVALYFYLFQLGFITQKSEKILAPNVYAIHYISKL